MEKLFINGMCKWDLNESLSFIENREAGDIISIVLTFTELGDRNNLLSTLPKKLKTSAGVMTGSDAETYFIAMRISPINKTTGLANEKGESRISIFAEIIRKQLKS